mgnify:CR=1 FL=1
MSTSIIYIVYTITKGMLDLLGDLKVLTYSNTVLIYLYNHKAELLTLSRIFVQSYLYYTLISHS